MHGPITLASKDFIKNKLKKLNLPFSEMTFGNLYLWRNEREDVLIEEEGVAAIKGVSRDRQPMIIPLEPLSETVEAYEKLLNKYPQFFLYPVPDVWCPLFSNAKYRKENRPEFNDYIYRTKKIADYSGRALDGKRNHVKHFVYEYPFEVFPFEEKFAQDALALLHAWKKEHPEPNDYFNCQEAIQLFDALELQGIVLVVEGKLVGFLLGERIHLKMFDVQFAKADLNYRGVYSFLFQSFAKQIDTEWLNYEYDIGIPALRKSKLEYAPDHFAVKWRIKKW